MIRFERVTACLDERVVLDRLDLGVAEGEILVLLGRSGAGKSTALRLVNRMLLPDRGTVRVCGAPTSEWDPIRLRRSVGYVIQEIGLFPHRTVLENVETVPRLLKWDPETRRVRALELLELVGLAGEEVPDRYPRALSGGQKQRVGVARALCADPAILLCDEPFGALDPITRRDLQTQFRKLSRELGKTVLLVTHDVGEALTVGDRVGLLQSGSLRFLGTPEDFRSSRDEAVREFRA
jgi:osmoprotectant transport system ATP-binding protein